MNSGFDHITPFFYDVEHIDDASCWCMPEVEDYGEGFQIIQHNSGIC
jgi:hypothetical protein